MEQSQIDLVKKAAKDLIALNTTASTLEVKMKLRTDNPYMKWYQSDIHDIMDDMAQNKELEFADLETYRTYFFPSPTQLRSIVSLSESRTTVAALIRDAFSKHEELEIEFYKKDGSIRKGLYICDTREIFDDLGYYLVMDEYGEIKRIDPRKIITVKINNVKYVVNTK